ncbi:MAG TPA: hypothetical protein VKT29_02950, partial [Terriglobales bacterium]|nr:hypothetical protein [Terriglobales bacterium]
IVAAAAEAGYSLDRFDFPWSRPEQQGAPAQPARDSRDPETQPGLILFRQNCAGMYGCRLLLVFVVGETPTSGVHKLALSSAMEQITELSYLAPRETHCADHQPLCVKVGLLAPYFTGAAASLRYGFAPYAHWRRGYEHRWSAAHGRNQLLALHVSMVSGDADAVDQLGLDRVPFQTQEYDSPTFKATINYEVESRDKFLLYLWESFAAEPDDMAIMREENTGYGTNFATASDSLGGFLTYLQYLRVKSRSGNPALSGKAAAVIRSIIRLLNQLNNAVGSGAMDTDTASSIYHGNLEVLTNATPLGRDADFIQFRKDYRNRVHGYLDLPFPLHISEIRGQREEQTAAQMINLLRGDPSVFPVLSPKTEGKDLMPSYSPLDKSSATLMMSNLLSTLAARKVHYVGIAASDVQDTIYLAREIHAHCPDAILFSFGSNLLFLNPDVAGDLRGMLLVSTYPLFTSNQDWAFPWKGGSIRYQFSSDRAEGLFNAMLALLGQRQSMLDYSPPFFTPAENDRTREPPVWITAVGKAAFVPIAILPQIAGLSTLYLSTADAPAEAIQAPPTWQIDPDSSWISILVFWSATFLGVWFAFVAVWPWSLRGRKSMWNARVGDLSGSRLLALAAFLLHLLVFYLIVCGLFIIPLACTTGALPSLIHRLLGYSPGTGICASIIDFTVAGTVAAAGLIAAIILLGATLIYLVKALFTFIWRSLGEQGRAALRGSAWPDYAPRARLRESVLALSDSVSSMILLAVPAGLFVLVLLYLISLLGPRGNSYHSAGLFFAAWRYLTPRNGASPLPPLFFASLALVLWAASNVRRAAMLETMTNRNLSDGSYLGIKTDSLRDIEVRQARIRSLLARGSLGQPLGIFTFVPLSIFFAATLIRLNGKAS